MRRFSTGTGDRRVGPDRSRSGSWEIGPSWWLRRAGTRPSGTRQASRTTGPDLAYGATDTVPQTATARRGGCVRSRTQRSRRVPHDDADEGSPNPSGNHQHDADDAVDEVYVEVVRGPRLDVVVGLDLAGAAGLWATRRVAPVQHPGHLTRRPTNPSAADRDVRRIDRRVGAPGAVATGAGRSSVAGLSWRG